MSSAPWLGETEPERLPPARAAACRELAGLLGFRHACPICAARLDEGAVVGFMTAQGLEEHLAAHHDGD